LFAEFICFLYLTSLGTPSWHPSMRLNEEFSWQVYLRMRSQVTYNCWFLEKLLVLHVHLLLYVHLLVWVFWLMEFQCRFSDLNARFWSCFLNSYCGFIIL
jgi:hypothetical protein